MASTLDTRRDQMFPRLEAAEIDRLRRFGTGVGFPDGAAVLRAGEAAVGMYVLLEGTVVVTRHDASSGQQPVIEQGPGQFVGELAQLSGRPSIVDAVARGTVEALMIPPERLRALLIAEAELGERIMRALILRRVSLIEVGAGPGAGRANRHG